MKRSGMRKAVMVAATVAVMFAFLPAVAQAAGAQARCKVCHSFSDSNRFGPGLKGVYGSKAGTHPGYRYKFTKYIKGTPWVWDEAHLKAWLLNSKKAIKVFTGNPKAKTKMPAQRVKGKQADEIIAFLKGLK